MDHALYENRRAAWHEIYRYTGYEIVAGGSRRRRKSGRGRALPSEYAFPAIYIVIAAGFFWSYLEYSLSVRQRTLGYSLYPAFILALFWPLTLLTFVAYASNRR